MIDPRREHGGLKGLLGTGGSEIARPENRITGEGSGGTGANADRRSAPVAAGAR